MASNLICLNARTRAERAASMRRAVQSMPGAFASVMRTAIQRASLDQYKESIRQRIEDMPVDSTRVLDDVRIELPDSAYEAMREDPDYEKWVLDTVRHAVADPDPDALAEGGRCVDLYFGRTKAQARVRVRPKVAARAMAARSSLASKKRLASAEWHERAQKQATENDLARADAQTLDTRSLLRHVGELEAVQGHMPLTTTEGVSMEVLNLYLSRLTRQDQE